MDLRQNLLRLFERYSAAMGVSESRVSTSVLSGGHRIARIRGGGSFTVATYDRVLRWFSDHWPEDAIWPEGVERPTPAAQHPEAA